MAKQHMYDKGIVYRRRRNQFAVAAVVCYLAGALLAALVQSTNAIIAVSIAAGVITLILISLAVLYGRGARAASRREAARHREAERAPEEDPLGETELLTPSGAPAPDGDWDLWQMAE